LTDTAKDKSYESIARQIFLLTGPADNVRSVTHCMTRLRLVLHQRPTLLLGQLRKIPGVLGVNDAEEELQIVLGPGRVAKVYDYYTALLRMVRSRQELRGETAAPMAGAAKAMDTREVSAAESLHAKIRARNATPVKLFFRRIASIFLPLIPGFIACGLISGLLNFALKLDPLLAGSGVFQLLGVAGGSVFWGMNLFIGWNTAKEFGGTPILGGTLGALLSHPGLAGVTLAGYPLAPGRGGVISVLLVAGLGAFVEKKIRRHVPEMFSLFLTPLLTFLLTGAAAILVLQPLGGLLSDLIGMAATTAIGSGGAIAGFLLAGTYLPMVMLGIHQALTPIHVELLNQYGVTILLPVLAMAGAGQVGASFAVYVKTKNHALRKTIASALPVGMLGVGEPLIYGVTLPLGRPFLGACIGGAFGGAVQAAWAVGSATIGISGLPLAAATDHIGVYLCGLLTAYVAGFLAAWLLGFDDPEEQS